MIHYAKLENSKRLQKTLAVLSDGNWHSTIEIRDRVNTCCPGTCIQELKANGIKIESRCAGKGRYEYRLLTGEGVEKFKEGGKPDNPCSPAGRLREPFTGEQGALFDVKRNGNQGISKTNKMDTGG